MSDGIGWLPVEARDALEEDRGKAGSEEADRLIALPPRQRVLELLARAAARTAEDADMRPDDLRRVLESFDGDAAPAEADLAERFPMLVAPPP